MLRFCATNLVGGSVFLSAKVSFHQTAVVDQLAGLAMHTDLTQFQNVGVVSQFQGHQCVLFHDQDGSAGFPDLLEALFCCRVVSVSVDGGGEKGSRSLLPQLGINTMDYDFVIHTPLMWLDKAQTWALADRMGRLDYVRNRTLTCYNGIKGDGCGECPACVLRKNGVEKYLAERK